MNGTLKIVAGIDLGGTDTKFGLVNSEGDVLSFNSIPTDSASNYVRFFEELSSDILTQVEKLDRPAELVGVSIGAPTGNQLTGTIQNASNLDWPENLPVANLLESHFQVPVTVMNDANAAALGELLYGVGRGKKDMICITLGTGLGSGIVIDGELLLGANGLAGEMGHIQAMNSDRRCGCGKLGCLETYVSATGIVKTAEELMESGEFQESPYLNFAAKPFSAKEITSAAMKGDSLALKAFDTTGHVLGHALADMVALFNPQLIVLTGGLAKAGALILDPVKAYTNRYLLDMYQETVEVELTGLSDTNTAILGAAASIWLKLDHKSTIKT